MRQILSNACHLKRRGNISGGEKMNGYGGKILRVNLSKKTSTAEILTPEFAKTWIGGRGFAAKILYDEVKKGTDPLSKDNKVIIAAGPLVGVFLPAGAKTTFASKSPATGGYGDSNMGGHFAPEMKYAGWDVIIIEGAASKPKILVIEDDTVEIRDAQKYWSQGSIDAEEMLKKDLGEDFQIAVIGPGGENMVRFACVSHDFGRQAGRTGIGAVLGSKFLKAIAIKGTKAIPLADRKQVLKLGKEMFRKCFESASLKIWQKYGTPGVVNWANDIGAIPTRNFQEEHSRDHKKLSGEVMRQTIVINDKACFGCPMACGKYSHTKKNTDYKHDVRVEGPEYETIALCGANCGFSDICDVAYANWLCDQLGIDTISAGNIVAFVMECFEKKILTKKEVGKDIKFGDMDSFEWLVKKIASQTGIGKILAQGSREAAKAFGKGAEKFAMQIKGLEISGYSFRNALAMALAYCTCDLGGHHNRAWAITHDLEVGRKTLKGKPEKVIFLQHARPMFDMLGVCRLQWVELGLELKHYPKILKAVTGFNYSEEDLLKISEKIWNLTRMFWVREIKDFGKSYDKPPERFYEKGILNKNNYGRLINRYYRLRSWTKNGIPTKKKLKELGLDFTIKDLQ